MNHAKFVIQVCKGLVRHQRARRIMMFYSVLLAMVMLFAGMTVLWSPLRTHPLGFLGYWAVCAWITFLAVLLALFDLVKVRGEARRERRGLQQSYFEKEVKDEDAR